jgi:predicted  nucleic acid-binding Zn-ribbon protein
MLDELALDAGQKGKIVDLLTADYKSRLDIRLEIQELYEKLGELRDDPEAASDAIVSANAALGEARGRLEAAARRTAREVRAILTPEQRRTLEEEAPRGCGGRRP